MWGGATEWLCLFQTARADGGADAVIASGGLRYGRFKTG